MLYRSACLVLCVFSSLSFAQTTPELDSPLEPREVFLKMIQANTNLAYSGSLAFERAGQLATYRVENISGNQSLEPLNRALPILTYSILCREESSSGPDLENLSNLYNFYRPGDTVVAGRPAIELLMLPVDANRNGYALSVDAENYLPLRTVVLTPQRTPLERYEFVNIEFFDAPDLEAPSECSSQKEQPGLWITSRLPDGFYIDSSKYETEADVTQLLVTDSLATVSISVEPVTAPKFPPVTTRLGATYVLLSYLSFQQQIYLATLVGEVPLESLELIAAGLIPNQAADQDSNQSVD